MNILTQIGIGLLPAAIVCMMLVVKKRMFYVSTIILSACIVAAGAAFTVSGFISSPQDNAEVSEKLSSAEMFDLAVRLSGNGEYDGAENILKQAIYSGECGCEYQLARARVSALEGNFKASKSVYELAFSGNRDHEALCESEYLAVCRALEAQNSVSSYAAAQYIASMGFDPLDYGFEISGPSVELFSKQSAINDAGEVIFKSIKGEGYSEAAGLICGVENAYNEFLKFESYDETSIKDIRKGINSLAAQYPQLLSAAPFRIARLKVNIMLGEYDDIAEQLGPESVVEEIMIASELYLNGYISRKDFPDGFSDIGSSELSMLTERMKLVYDKHFSEESKTVRAEVREKIASVEAKADNVAVFSMKDMLVKAAGSEDTSADSTKLYLQASKIETTFGDEQLAEKHMQSAFDSAGDITDPNLAVPMYQVISIINNNDDTQNIKDIAIYADKIIDNVMPIALTSTLKTPNQGVKSGSQPVAQPKQGAFSQAVVSYATKSRAAINIGVIDISEFPKITARVQIGSDMHDKASEIKNAISVADCGAAINNFTLDKFEYEGANIILCCDLSGSMSSNIGSLKDAVSLFVGKMRGNEKIGLMTFNSSVKSSYAIGTPAQDLLAAVEGFKSSGGTNIYGTLIAAINEMPEDIKANNVIVMMTDGADGHIRTADEINSNIGIPAQLKGITIYTLGLGSNVNAEYLTNIASSSNGDFIYSPDTVTLEQFFELIHKQLANQYILKYEAQNTLLMINRVLAVSLPDESVSDAKTYSLAGAGDDVETVIFDENITINGLSARIVYKSGKPVELQLKGSGFEKNTPASVSISGATTSLTYSLSAEYVDAETYKVIVPANVAVDVYNLSITIAGKKAVLPNELTVLDSGSSKTVSFGPYVFTGNRVYKSDDTVVIYGGVNMNGWLDFKGQVSLTGDIEHGSSVVLNDEFGSYVSFDAKTSSGLAKLYVNKGWHFDVASFGDLRIYNDPNTRFDTENYPVERKTIAAVAFTGTIWLNAPHFMLYPDRMEFEFSQSTTYLPFQDALLKSVSGKDSPFSLSVESKCMVSGNAIGLLIDFNGSDKSEKFKAVNLFSQRILLDFNKLKFKIDTFNDEYSFEFMVNIGFIDTAIGLGMGWKDHCIDSVALFYDHDFNTNISGVPVTFSDFSLALKDMSSRYTIDGVDELLDMKLQGKLSISACKVSAFMPAFKKYVGDLSILSLPETTFEVGLRKLYFMANAQLYFLEEIKVAEAQIELGNFSYSNELLGLNAADVSGFVGYLETGITWDIDKVHASITGRGTVSLTNRFCGFEYDARAELDLKWWLFSKNYSYNCKILLGFYTQENRQKQFTVRIREVGQGKVKGVILIIDPDGDADFDTKKYYV